MQKRDKVFIQEPSVYLIGPCPCGNTQTQWSEYEKHLWCDKCQKDFIPEDNGIFPGPIMLGLCKSLGMNFAKLNLKTNEIEVLDKQNEYAVALKFQDVLCKDFSVIVKEAITKQSIGVFSLNYKNNQLHLNSFIKNDVLSTSKELTTELIFINPFRSFVLSWKLEGDTIELQDNKEAKTLMQYLFINKLDNKLTHPKLLDKKSKI